MRARNRRRVLGRAASHYQWTRRRVDMGGHKRTRPLRAHTGRTASRSQGRAWARSFRVMAKGIIYLIAQDPGRIPGPWQGRARSESRRFSAPWFPAAVSPHLSLAFPPTAPAWCSGYAGPCLCGRWNLRGVLRRQSWRQLSRKRPVRPAASLHSVLLASPLPMNPSNMVQQKRML